MDSLEQFSDIISLGQVEHQFDIPGSKSTHTVKVGVLWNSDIVKIKDRAARRVIAGDVETRREIEIVETLVEAILTIDGKEFYNTSDSLLHDNLKAQLRGILDKANPAIITFIYQEYMNAVTQSRTVIDGRIDDIKKSSGSSQPEKTPDLT